jgi:hypothetical protein
MNRLRDEAGSDPISERGVEILRGVRPTESSPGLKQRVWASIQRTPVGPIVGLRRPGWKALAAGVTVLAIAATAGATIGGRWIAAVRGRAHAPDAAPRAKPSRPRGATARRIADAVEGAPDTTAPPAVAASVARPSDPVGPARTAPSRSASASLSRRAASSAASTPSSARTEVLDALIALRRDHDAERAAQLLDHYLGTNRRGALREEALVLAIEAADARHDEIQARGFAHAYQLEFPAGRFAAFAQHHLTSVQTASPQ